MIADAFVIKDKNLKRRHFLNLVTASVAVQAGPVRAFAQLLGGDDTDELNALFHGGGHITLPNRPLKIGGTLKVPSTATIEFLSGSVLEISGSGSIEWNGGIKAAIRQQIFSGILVRGSFQRVGNTPYVFSVQGTPSIQWSSPFWFGASGNGSDDDIIPLYCAQYFGGRQFIPAGQYAVSQALHLRRSQQTLAGNGPSSVIKAMRDNLGQVIAVRGEPPNSPNEPPQYPVSGVSISDISIDGIDATNTNGIGLTCASNCTIDRIVMQNIGRKAITLQYWCQKNTVSDVQIISALQEKNGNTAALSIEGQRSGIDFSLDGGVSLTQDIQGWDCVDNVFSNVTILKSTYRYILLERARNNRFVSIMLGQPPASRSDLFFGVSAENNEFENIRRVGEVTACSPIRSNIVVPAAGTNLVVTTC